jgi:hypothetical protein
MTIDHPSHHDPALADVLAWIGAHPQRTGDGLSLEEVFARAVRKAIDEVIDGARTGRYLYDQLERQEKAYIGTRVEIVVRTELELDPTGRLDTVIAGHEVDIKWSAHAGWMIPREAVGELCLVLSGDEAGGKFSVGLVRCTDERLTRGANQDAKRSLSSEGKGHIRWIIPDAVLPVSFLATLDDDIREAILAKPAGQARVRELFTRVTKRPVPREVIPTLAVQEDPMRRVRSDRGGESLGGLKILSGHYAVSRRAADLLGYGPLSKRDYLSVPLDELTTLPGDVRRQLNVA